MKDRTRSRLRLGPDTASQAIHRGFANRQADPGAGVLFAVQALKDPKDIFQVLRFDTDAVVLDGKNPSAVLKPRGDANLERLDGAILDGVADQVLKQLQQQDLDGIDHRQRLAFDTSAGFFDGSLQIGEGHTDYGATIDARNFLIARFADVYILAQGREQRSHARRAVLHAPEHFGFTRVKPASGRLRDPLGIAEHHQDGL